MPLSEFCRDFGVDEASIGHVTRLGRRCYLTLPAHEPLIDRFRKGLFAAGVYLGEEKGGFEPTPALLELISANTGEHKAVVDGKAAWLFLCGRDLFEKGILRAGEPTKEGRLLVENERGENLGYGLVPDGRGRRKNKNVAVKNLLDRGFFLRRERLR